MLLYQTLDLFLPDAQEEICVFAESFCGCDDCFENAGLGPCGFLFGSLHPLKETLKDRDFKYDGERF